MRMKRRWADLDQGQQAAIVAGAVAELVLTAAAVLDLSRRPTATIRGGSKLLWLLAFVVQPFGPLAYFSLGRLPDSGDDAAG
jgi:hypothetical protein